MLKKLRLEKMNDYERCVALKRLSNMVIDFAEGRIIDLDLGREQGDIDRWDDIVVRRVDGIKEHHQVKYQQDDFDDTNKPDKNEIPPKRGRKPKEPKPETKTAEPVRKPSPLDEALQSLAQRYLDPAKSPTDREFHLHVPHTNTQVKKGIKIFQFDELVTACRIPATSAMGLEARASGSPLTQELFMWLTTWCEFTDWSHILRALSRLHIKTVGVIGDVESETESILSRKYTPARDARQSLLAFLNQNTADTATITAALAFDALRKHLATGVTTWTQFYLAGLTGNRWSISGINGNSQSGEVPDSIVPAFWGNSQVPRSLRVVANWPPPGQGTDKLQQALGRLAVHVSGAVLSHMSCVTQWTERVGYLVGGTLGTQKESPFGHWLPCNGSYSIEDGRNLDTLEEHEAEAESLHHSMDLLLLKEVSRVLISKQSEIENTAFRKDVQETWEAWKSSLETDPLKLRRVLAKLLTPAAEEDLVEGIIRAGPRTKELIGEAIHLMTVVAAAFPESTVPWESIAGKTVAALALKFWGGPRRPTRQVKRLDQSAREVLSYETSQILIVSGVEAAACDLKEESLADDAKQNASLASERLPAVITNHISINSLISEGDRSTLRSHLLKLMSTSEEQVRSHLKDLKGVE